MFVLFDEVDDPSPEEVPEVVADVDPEDADDDVPDDPPLLFAPSDLADFALAPESVL